jgi:predicted PurR-regulated permease PerM
VTSMDIAQRGEDNRIERTVAAILLLLLAAGCIVVLRPFLSALLWATIISSSTWPIYTRIERMLGGRRTAAAAVMVMCVAALLLLPLAALTSHLVSEVTQVAAIVGRSMEAGLPEPPSWLGTLPLVGTRAVAYWQDVASDTAKLTADIRAYIGPAREWILSTGVSLGSGITELVLALLISFFLYRDGMGGAQALRAALSRVAGGAGERLLSIASGTIQSVVYGVVGTNLVEAILATFGLRIVGVPGAFFLGFVLFFLTLVPLAPALVFAPAIIWLVLQGATSSAIFLSVWYVVVFILLEGGLRSYLVSRGGEIPLLLVFLGMLGGALAFGLLGIFLGPTLLAVGSALLREWNSRENDELGGARPEPHAWPARSER